MNGLGTSVRIELDLEDPMVAGGQIMDAAAIPMLKGIGAAEFGGDDEGMARLWCGALASFLAVMTSEIGVDAAQAAYRSLAGAFDEVRAMRRGMN